MPAGFGYQFRHHANPVASVSRRRANPRVPVRVKICGITSLADAEAAIRFGADALGFMFYEPSPHCLTFAQAAAIIRDLPPLIATVGVFVDAPEATVREAIATTGINTLQFHGHESPEFCRQFGLKTLRAFRLRDRATLDELPAHRDSAWLLDSYVPGVPGGSGQTFNWDLAVAARALGGRVILAGGLTPANVEAAVRQVRPFGLDVSSGVESAPGRKDPARLEAFLLRARAAWAALAPAAPAAPNP